MNFKGTEEYVATDELQLAVNASIKLEKPLLIQGEPGTGKTMLAEQIAGALDIPLIQWHIKSTTKAQQGLYEYDAVSRLRDSQLGDEKVKDISNYIIRGKIWEAFASEKQCVLLIDEIDKADIEFPNDLLLELDKMEFFVYETGETIIAVNRPIVIITSNNEKELPDAFLRRCFFHYIKFPEAETMEEIVNVQFPNITKDLISEAFKIFYDIRDVPGIKKKPSTSELSDWIKLLMNDDVNQKTLKEREPKNSSLYPPSSTLSIGGVFGGIAHNVIADKCHVNWETRPVVKEDGVFLNQEIDKYANEVLLPDMKKVFPDASIEKNIIGEIIGFDRKDRSDACEFISSLTGDNSRQVVSFGTEAGLYQEIGVSTVVCGPGSIEQAHKIDEFIVLDELKKCLSLLDGINKKSIPN